MSSAEQRRLQRPHFDLRTLHQLQQNLEVLAPGQRFIALHVDVHIGLDGLRDFVNPLGAAAVLGRGHAAVPAVLAAHGRDLLRIGRHDHVVELRAGAGRSVDVSEHGLAGDLTKNLARQPRRGQARGNDGDSFHSPSFRGRRRNGKPNLLVTQGLHRPVAKLTATNCEK